MFDTFKIVTLTSAIVLSTAALAQEPSFVEGGITPERYYDGGSAAGALAEQHLKTFDELDFECSATRTGHAFMKATTRTSL